MYVELVGKRQSGRAGFFTFPRGARCRGGEGHTGLRQVGIISHVERADRGAAEFVRLGWGNSDLVKVDRLSDRPFWIPKVTEESGNPLS
jgi:hypothetical protein